MAVLVCANVPSRSKVATREEEERFFYQRTEGVGTGPRDGIIDLSVDRVMNPLPKQLG